MLEAYLQVCLLPSAYQGMLLLPSIHTRPHRCNVTTLTARRSTRSVVNRLTSPLALCSHERRVIRLCGSVRKARWRNMRSG